MKFDEDMDIARWECLRGRARARARVLEYVELREEEGGAQEGEGGGGYSTLINFNRRIPSCGAGRFGIKREKERGLFDEREFVVRLRRAAPQRARPPAPHRGAQQPVR